MADSGFSDAAQKCQKAEADDAELEKNDQVLEALEADLAAAQAAADAAEERYNLVSRWVARENAKLAEKPSDPRGPVYIKEKEVDDDKIVQAVAQKGEPVSHGEKNTSALTAKEVSRSKWEANHAKELRVREATKKAKQNQRRGQREAKYARAEVDNEQEEPSAAAAAEEKAAAPEKKAADAGEQVADIDEGAKSIAERMKSLTDLPSATDKRDVLLKVMTVNRENYFSSDPAEVVLNLQEKNLVTPALASDLMAILNDVAPVKGPALSPDQWLEHAKKMANLQRPDEKPFSANEFAYLKSIDDKHLKDAESELLAAEAHLQKLVQLSESWFPAAESPSVKPAPPPVSGEVEVDVDKAALLEDQNEKKSESRGSKNTSALPSKVVSKDKWLANRGHELREREKGVKSRQARRAECLERKMQAADVSEHN